MSQADLEHELAIIRDAGAENGAGVFGPGSMMWRIDRAVVPGREKRRSIHQLLATQVASLVILLLDCRPSDAKDNLLLLARAAVGIGLPRIVEGGQENFLGMRREAARCRSETVA